MNSNSHAMLEVYFQKGCDFICNLCHQSKFDISNFTKHMKVAHNIIMQCCKKCNLLFNNLGQYYLHCRQEHKEKGNEEDAVVKKHMCQFCSYSTNNGGVFKNHMRAHTGYKPYECEICHKTFSQISNMRVHRKRHIRSLIDFYCDDCDLSFSSHDTLLYHKQSKEHLLNEMINQSPNFECAVFVCKVCSTFETDNVEMMLNHAQEGCNIDYASCKTCSIIILLKKENLREHRSYHRDLNLFCSFCESPTQFKKRSLLIKHLSKTHNMSIPNYFTCRYCENTFESRETLEQHKIDIHSSEIKCHNDNQLTGRINCIIKYCSFRTNSFILYENHMAKEHAVRVSELTPKDWNVINCYTQKKESKSRGRGRPKLCDLDPSEIKKSEEIVLNFTQKKRGRPKKIPDEAKKIKIDELKLVPEKEEHNN